MPRFRFLAGLITNAISKHNFIQFCIRHHSLKRRSMNRKCDLNHSFGEWTSFHRQTMNWNFLVLTRVWHRIWWYWSKRLIHKVIGRTILQTNSLNSFQNIWFIAYTNLHLPNWHTILPGPREQVSQVDMNSKSLKLWPLNMTKSKKKFTRTKLSSLLTIEAIWYMDRRVVSLH